MFINWRFLYPARVNSRFFGVKYAKKCSWKTRGVGDINAINLLAKKVKVNSAGVSTVRVAASNDIQIEVTGVSTVLLSITNGEKTK